MGVRRKGREHALHILYLVDITQMSQGKALATLKNDPTIEEEIFKFSRKLAEGALAHKEVLDAAIVKYAKNWELNRMAALDRNILRLGAYELLFEKETPVSVIIDEAVEIAKEFRRRIPGNS